MPKINDAIFREILGESLRREFAEFDSAPEHKFSLKHRLAMKRILSKYGRYEKNTREAIELSSATMPRYRLKQKIIIALVIVILMTLLTGWFFPLHRVTEVQVNWLRSRYDFPNMMINLPEPFTVCDGNNDVVVLGVYRVNDDYLDFLSDLEEMGIYTAEEIEKIDSRGYEPRDTRPDSFKKETLIMQVDIDLENETPLSRAQDAISWLEKRIDYYIERSKDKARAVEGDLEFAAEIRDNYLSFYQNHLKLLEKLYAERSDDDRSYTTSNTLLNIDKDDRKYLFIIHESEKL